MSKLRKKDEVRTSDMFSALEKLDDNVDIREFGKIL
jgi:hypothetical protein